MTIFKAIILKIYQLEILIPFPLKENLSSFSISSLWLNYYCEIDVLICWGYQYTYDDILDSMKNKQRESLLLILYPSLNSVTHNRFIYSVSIQSLHSFQLKSTTSLRGSKMP